MKEAIEQVARVCHEANRAYCKTLGDDSQLAWDEAPEWQRDSARNGALFHFSQHAVGQEASAQASHYAWLAQKKVEGWKYGPIKNAETKEHPCFVSYDALPMDQRRKDYIFAAICKVFYETSTQEVAA